MERAPGFIGTAGVPLVWQANISCLAEFIPTSALKFSGALRQKILVHLTSRERIDNMCPFA